MHKVKLTLLVFIALALMVLAVQNTAPFEARFLWMTAEVPAVVLLFLTLAGGFIAGVLATLLSRRKPKAKFEDKGGQ